RRCRCTTHTATCRPSRGTRIAVNRAMKTTDLIIIYFACGAPLGVYYFTRLAGGSATSVIWALARFLVWPVSAAVLLRDKFLAGRPSEEAILDRMINDIRARIEGLAFAGASTAAVFDFRDVFTRFTSLTSELRNNPEKLSNHEIFTISGHENS